MPQLSTSAQDWDERVRLLNYRCRTCREHIRFADQELYFSKGSCALCLEGAREDRRLPGFENRVQEIRRRGGPYE